MSLHHDPAHDAPLTGVAATEVASWVAAPSAGLTLAQLGADVVRVDPLGGAQDRTRWPLAPSGSSLYWAGLNRGKRSVVLDLRDPRGQELCRALAGRGGHEGGVLVDNLPGADWLSPEAVRRTREDLVHVRVTGRPDGGPSLDYTANAAVGVPTMTGAPGEPRPVNHVLPAWDLVTGLHVVTAVLGALRRRSATGEGSTLTVSLDEVALAGVASLGWAAEAETRGRDRERQGNAVYGGYGSDFRTRDDRHVLVVALTRRQWRALTEATGTRDVFACLADALGLDLDTDEGRYEAREVVTAVLRPWFAARDAVDVGAELDAARVLWGPYRSMTEAVAPYADDPPGGLLGHVDQPGIGRMLVSGHPVRGLSPCPPAASPVLGAHTAEVLAGDLGLTDAEIGRLVADGVVEVAAEVVA